MSKALMVRIALFIGFQVIGLPGLLDDLGTWAVWLKPMGDLFDNLAVSLFFIISGGLILTYPQWYPRLREKMRPFYSKLPIVLWGSELEKLERALEIAQNERDKYKQQVEDKDRELSTVWSGYKALQEEHGNAVLWANGQECTSRRLTVAVQYVSVGDYDLAKKIRWLLAYHLQSRDLVNSKKYPAKHITLPFNNPSRDARIVIFSDSDVGFSVKNAFNRYNLLGEKAASFEKSIAGGELPEVDIAIVIFPFEGTEE